MQRWIAQRYQEGKFTGSNKLNEEENSFSSEQERRSNACWICVICCEFLCVNFVYATGGVSLCIVTALRLILTIITLHIPFLCTYMINVLYGKTKHCSVLIRIFPTPGCLFNWLQDFVTHSCINQKSFWKLFSMTTKD